ncbi:MAG TPA: glycoside hydrolase family 43 protein [Chitinispirillaceae bacterium]|nr:glycoside hydrolase family 43 protein [Chitinispirillaceae bacterium]
MILQKILKNCTGFCFTIPLYIAIAFVVLLRVVPATASSTCLFFYFINNGEDGLHLAYSTDGQSFTALNKGQSLLKPLIGKDRLMRDPSAVRGPDGVFHLVWTSGWNDRCIGYASSKDLITWSKQDSIFVMKNEPTARNCWAPEIFFDDVSEQYIIIWSTTIPGKFPESQTSCDNSYNHRIYYVTSKDMKVFSETNLFYDPGFNCIDGFIARDSNRYALVFKDETCTDNAKGTKAAKNFRIAYSDSVIGPYGNLSGVIPAGTDWVEGPSMIKIGSTWFLYYDIYTQGRYGIRKSGNLTSWQNVTDNMNKPSGARHGTVTAVTGFLIDNSAQAGFRWEPVVAVSPLKFDRKTPAFVISCNNDLFTIKTVTTGSFAIYMLDGSLLTSGKISSPGEHRITCKGQTCNSRTVFVQFSGSGGTAHNGRYMIVR